MLVTLAPVTPQLLRLTPLGWASGLNRSPTGILVMQDRLLVGVLGHRDSGKSRTWDTLFGARVKTGKKPRKLELRPGESVEVFLISGSPEERQLYVGDILTDNDCRIVLCSMQYTHDVRDTLDYFLDRGFSLYIQWLNPGFRDTDTVQDSLGLRDEILSAQSTFSVRDGRIDPEPRVGEIREFIYGWAIFRNLNNSS